METFLRERLKRLADGRLHVDGPKFMGAGVPISFGSGDAYETVLVRCRDKDSALPLLSVFEETAADVALLVDVVAHQAAALAEQQLQIDRIRFQLESLRHERLVTDVAKQMNAALIEAAGRGIGFEGFEFEIATDEDTTEDATRATSSGEKSAAETSDQTGGAFEIGAIVNFIRGAHLAGKRANAKAVEADSRLKKISRAQRSASRKLRSVLKVERLLPAKPTT